MGLEIIKKSNISSENDECPYNIGSIYKYVGKGEKYIPCEMSFYMCARIGCVLCMVNLTSGIARSISLFDSNKNMELIDVTDKIKFQIDIPRSIKDIFPIINPSSEFEIGQTYLSNDVFMVICRQLYPDQVYAMFLADGSIQLLPNTYNSAFRSCNVKMYVNE